MIFLGIDMVLFILSFTFVFIQYRMYKIRRRPKMIGSFRIMLLKEKIDALNKHKRFICSRIFDEGGYARCEENY